MGRGGQARVREEGTGGMLLCVLVRFTFVGGLKSSSKGLYGHLLGHTSYFKNNFLLLLQDNSCVTPGGVWGSYLGERGWGGSGGEPEALIRLLPWQEAGRMLWLFRSRLGRDGARWEQNCYPSLG